MDRGAWPPKSTGSQRVGRNWVTKHSTAKAHIWGKTSSLVLHRSFLSQKNLPKRANAPLELTEPTIKSWEILLSLPSGSKFGMVEQRRGLARRQPTTCYYSLKGNVPCTTFFPIGAKVLMIYLISNNGVLPFTLHYMCCCFSVAQSCLILWDPRDYSTPGLPVLHHLPELAQTHVHWVDDAIQTLSSVIPFSFCLQYFPASGSFLMSQLFTLGGQSIGASASVFPMNSQDWFPVGWTGWISLQSKGLSKVFSNTTVQKHQFFSAQLSSQSSSHIHTWPLEKPKSWLDGPHIFLY